MSKKPEQDTLFEAATIKEVEEKWNERISYIRHEINNITAVLGSGFECVSDEIENRKLDLGEDGKGTFHDMGEVIKKLIDLSKNMNPEKIDDKMKPFIKRDKAENEETEKENSAEIPKSKAIFVIDDEELILKSLKRIAEGLGKNSNKPNVSTFLSAIEAKKVIEEGRYPDLIICDFMMPVMTGQDFYEWLKESHPDLAATVLFVTGGAITESGKKFLGEMELRGQVLTKPFATEDIRDHLQKALNLC